MRIRFQLRWAMLAMIPIALAVGPVSRYVQALRDRSREYADRAKIEAIMSGMYAARATLRHRLSPAEQEHAKAIAAWRARRSAAYQRAASRPWTVVPDEPEPPAPAPAPLVAETPEARRRLMFQKGYDDGAEQARRIIEAQLRTLRAEREGSP